MSDNSLDPPSYLERLTRNTITRVKEVLAQLRNSVRDKDPKMREVIIRDKSIVSQQIQPFQHLVEELRLWGDAVRGCVPANAHAQEMREAALARPLVRNWGRVPLSSVSFKDALDDLELIEIVLSNFLDKVLKSAMASNDDSPLDVAISTLPTSWKSARDIIKRRAIILQNPEMSARDLCKRFDLEGVPLPADWSADSSNEVKDWLSAYLVLKLRSRIDSIISIDRRKSGATRTRARRTAGT